MARIFLDANILIDLIEKRGEIITARGLTDNEIFISPLSIHILIYITRQKIPPKRLIQIIELFSLVSFDQSISTKSLQGPTRDFEDNVQLHSATESECDFFLTQDKNLLNLKFFGKTQLVNSLKSSKTSIPLR